MGKDNRSSRDTHCILKQLYIERKTNAKLDICIMSTIRQMKITCHSFHQRPWSTVHFHLSSSRMDTLIGTSCRRLFESIAISPPTSQQRNDISCSSSLKETLWKGISVIVSVASRVENDVLYLSLMLQSNRYILNLLRMTELGQKIAKIETLLWKL